MMNKELSANTTLSHYRIVSKIGAGGMGEVYLAVDTRLDRKVALKLLPADFANDIDRIRRFEQEARATSALNHPNILIVYDIGTHQDSPFIVAELLEGEELRAKLKASALSLRGCLDYAQQIASGLSAAHEKGIVHRDLKPENLFVTKDGRVKILDFGLAKLNSQKPVGGADSQAPTMKLLTNPGVVMGTPSYLSPEQVRGQDLDARSDIFSLGVVLYEMLAGRPPFAGVNAIDIMGAILNQEPAPLKSALSDVPEALAHQLDHLVTKVLRKDREQRYQTSKDLLIDLQDLNEEMAFAAKLERSMQPDKKEPVTTRSAIAKTGETAATPTASGVNFILSEVKRHRRGVALTLLVMAIAAIATFYYFNRKPVLTDRDTILLTEFDNKTNDAVFDATLRQGLAVQLQQSPFLSLFPDARVRDTLKLMGYAPAQRVTREIGKEICLRQGLKALIAGTIVTLGRNYSLTLEAINGQSGETIALTQVEAEGKEQILKALSQASSQMREKLGESLGSIRKFDKPLELTTSSLEALKAFSLGNEQASQGKVFEAIRFYQHAVETAPDFAVAYVALAGMYAHTNQPGLAAENAEKAFALKDRVSEKERAGISLAYYTFVTGELDKRIEALEIYQRSYPDEVELNLSLAHSRLEIGQFEKSVEEARKILQLHANDEYTSAAYLYLKDAYLRLNEFAQALEICEHTLQQQLDLTAIHASLYQIAFVNADAAAMQQQVSWASGKPDEYVALDWQTGAAAFTGEWRRAQSYSRRAMELGRRSDAKGATARFAAEQALRAAVFAQFTQAKAAAAQALAFERNKVTLTRAALTLALCGEVSQAQALADRLGKTYPKDTLINGIWLPAIGAALELQSGNAQLALERLEAARRYEAAAEFLPQYLRGLAYLRFNKPVEAAAEFQKILDHRGEAPLSALYALAYLGLARSAAITGDTAKARKSYEDFLALWKDADADLPVLIAAKKEYEKVK